MEQLRKMSLMPLAVATVFLTLTGCEEKDISTDDVEMNEETGSISENIESEPESATEQSVEEELPENEIPTAETTEDSKKESNIGVIFDAGEELDKGIRRDFFDKYGNGVTEDNLFFTYDLYSFADNKYSRANGGMPFEKVELYYDEETGSGCGFNYIFPDGESEIYGFYFTSTRSIQETFPYNEKSYIDGFYYTDNDEVIWKPEDPYSTLTVYGKPAENYVVAGYREEYEYDENGRMTVFRAYGMAQEDVDQGLGESEILTINFFYDEEGNLREKWYRHNPAGRYFGYPDQFIWQYDEKGRLLVRYEFGNSDREEYYIYESDAETPKYVLEVYINLSVIGDLYEVDID